MFQVQILGTSSAIPTVSRFPSSQVVTINDRHHLIDCGEGTQMQLLRYKVRLSRLDAIFISHLHGDHILGLPGLLNTLSLYERSNPLKLFAPSALKGVLDTIFSQTHSYLCYELEFIPTEDFQPGEVAYARKNFEVKILPLEHRVFCRGFHFQEVNKKPKFNFYKAKSLGIPNNYFSLLKQGNSITLENGLMVKPEEVHFEPDPPLSFAYCSDTRYSEELIEYIRYTRLLYHEATFLHELKSRAEETCHSTALEAGKIASQAEVRQLILGHYSARYRDLTPLLKEARSVFPQTALAKEGHVFKLKDFL